MSYDVDEKKPNVRLRKITKDRLKNIALYYLQRFETTQAKLREVLKRRVDNYAFYFPEFDRAAAYVWIEEILQDCVRYQYIDDMRFAKLKIQDYLNAGKSEKYIRLKMAEKGGKIWKVSCLFLVLAGIAFIGLKIGWKVETKEPLLTQGGLLNAARLFEKGKRCYTSRGTSRPLRCCEGGARSQSGGCYCDFGFVVGEVKWIWIIYAVR